MGLTEVDSLFVDRWNDVVSLVEAFRDFEARGLDALDQKAGPIVRDWLLEQGFELEIDAKYGDYKASRPGWEDGDEQPIISLVVGGLLPRGMAKVEADAPYLWVYSRAAQPVRSQAAEQLRRSVEPQWLDRDITDKQPLGRYLRQDVPDRLQFIRDPTALANFAISQFPNLIALEGLLSRAYPSIGS